MLQHERSLAAAIAGLLCWSGGDHHAWGLRDHLVMRDLEYVQRRIYIMGLQADQRRKAAGLITVFICSRLHHEKWQLVGFTVVQMALIGSMASVGSDDHAQAIVTVVLAAITITPPQLLSFTMLSFGVDDQTDL